MHRQIVCAQGEITVFRVSDIPLEVSPLRERDALNRPIIGHSESGHHHVLDRDVAVVESAAPPEGMRILYALLDSPTNLIQDALDAHGSHRLEPGTYEFRIAREYDPFADQARLVAD